MRFAGNNPMPQIKSDSVLPTTFNYFIGDNQSKWYTDVASYSSIHYQGIYPGIDLHYDSNHGQMKVPILWLQALIPARSAGTTNGATSVQINAANGALEVSIQKH